MMTRDEVRDMVGIMGNIISLGLFISPLQTFMKIVKKKDVEQFVPDPYLATFLNCMLWILYGMPFVHPHSFLVLTINGAGFVIELVYLGVFFAYAPKPMRVKMLAVLGAEFVFVAAVAAGVFLGADNYERRSLVVGTVAAFFGTLMYAAPLTVMKQVIATKSVKYMPLTVSVVSLLNGICWTTYALIRFDIFVTIPNSIGVLLCIGQLVLYFCYYDGSASKTNTVELPTTAGDGAAV